MIKLGVIGCGHWGPNFVRNFSQIKGTRVRYACDLNPNRLARIKNLYPEIKTTRNYHAILNDRDVDAVVIATPAKTHYKLAKQTLLNNKHLLIEKPIAMNIRNAKDLVDIAKAKRKILMVGHTFKFNPGINKLKWLIKTNALGRVHYIYSRRTNLGPLRRDINAMWDLAPHDISILSYILNAKPIDVRAAGRKFLDHGLEDVVFMTLTYPRNVFAHVHVSWLDPRKIREITVVGDKKMAVFDDLDVEKPIKVYDKSVVKKTFKQDYDSFKEFQLIIRNGKTYSPRVNFKEPLKIECAHFIECIKRKMTPLTDGEDGLSVLKVMLALQKSLDKDSALVKLNEIKDSVPRRPIKSPLSK